jgi:hypothetical protein
MTARLQDCKTAEPHNCRAFFTEYRLLITEYRIPVTGYQHR